MVRGQVRCLTRAGPTYVRNRLADVQLGIRTHGRSIVPYVNLHCKGPAAHRAWSARARAACSEAAHAMVRSEMAFLSGPSCATSLWAALGRAVGAHRSVSTVSGRPRAACRAWHVELAERQAALASLLSQRPSHRTNHPDPRRPRPAFPPRQADVRAQNGSYSLPHGCSAPRGRSC